MTDYDYDYDFYTIGYSKATIDSLIERLKSAKPNITDLIDVRKTPHSGRWQRERYQVFDKDPLDQSLQEVGINYIHMPELGVPSERRKNLSNKKGRQILWDWYDENVIEKNKQELDYLLTDSKDRNRKIVFMCTERDPLKCHRHRIAKYYESKGLKGLDI